MTTYDRPPPALVKGLLPSLTVKILGVDDTCTGLAEMARPEWNW